MRFFKTNGESDGGTAIVEYALIVGVIALLSVSAVTLAGERTGETFTDVVEALDPESDRSLVESDGSDESDDGGQSDQPSAPGDSEDPEDSDDPEDREDPENTEDPEDTEDLEDTEEVSIPTVADTSATGEWKRKGRSNNYDGVWMASVEYANTSGQTQYLTLQVTMVSHNGKTESVAIGDFELPADGSAVFNHEGNEVQLNGGQKKGITEVRVQVIAVTTTGDDEQTHTVEVDQEPVSVEAPTP